MKSKVIVGIMLALLLISITTPVTAQNPCGDWGRIGRLQFEIGLVDETGYYLLLVTEAKVGENISIRFIFWPESDMRIHLLSVSLGGAIPKNTSKTLIVDTDVKAWTQIMEVFTVKPNLEGWIGYWIEAEYTDALGYCETKLRRDFIYARDVTYDELKTERDVLKFSYDLLLLAHSKLLEEAQRITSYWMITAIVFMVTTIALAARTVYVAKRKSKTIE